LLHKGDDFGGKRKGATRAGIRKERRRGLSARPPCG